MKPYLILLCFALLSCGLCIFVQQSCATTLAALRWRLKRAKYIDLTHTISPSIPVWAGFGASTFGPAVDPKTSVPYSWSKDGFEATRYQLATDQLGTQLDPPAHWNPDYPAIDELPPTFAVRPLVVISIEEQVAISPGYSLSVKDILTWEATHDRIPEGSVVFVRSGWAKEWPDPTLATRRPFPGVSLEALKLGSGLPRTTLSPPGKSSIPPID